MAKSGQVTSQIQFVANKEKRSVESILAEVSAGTVVIPTNVNHKNLSPVGIGRSLYTKINANIGNSTLSSCPKAELEKLNIAIKYGADTVMDLSTGSNVAEIRKQIIENSRVPIGTVPVYEALSRINDPNELTSDLILDVIRQQAEQGVDYMTIHAGILLEHLPLAKKRLLKIVSRGGSIIAAWMQKHKEENPFYVNFEKILAICQEHDVTLSLGDALRPGCLADASDEAQFAELTVLGSLVRKCRAANVQVMVEGPGHVPFNQIAMNMQMEQRLCDDAPFYVLGPLVIDCAPGYDHITGAIGATMGAFYGAAMLCYVTPKEHLGLPNAEDVRNGVIAYKIAAHASDVALNKPGARERDDAISKARFNFDWEKQFSLALDPDKAREFRLQAINESNPTDTSAVDGENNFCTMCGPGFCSMRTSSKL